MKKAAETGGPLPSGFTEAQLWERFGWTPSEMDNEDETRIMRGVQLLNANAAYRAVLRAVAAHHPETVSREQWQVYSMIQNAAKELGDDKPVVITYGV